MGKVFKERTVERGVLAECRLGSGLKDVELWLHFRGTTTQKTYGGKTFFKLSISSRPKPALI